MGYEARKWIRVGNYELGRVLGEGMFAVVRLARDIRTGEGFAIKVLDRKQILKHNMASQVSYTQNASILVFRWYVNQMKREISTMKLVRHPNIVLLREVMASKTKVYMVLELVRGGELLEKIAHEGKLTEDQARKYFQQLVGAVDFCHSRGVCHRDLKPENLLLDSKGNLKITDFGLSALPHQRLADGLLHTTCGTPNYVAPEVVNDKGYDGFTADVWSCGVTLFVLLAGYLPFDEPNVRTLYKKICRAEFTFPSWFSSGARDLIQRILDPNPKTRITIPEILGDEWFKRHHKPMTLQVRENVNLDDVNAVFNDSEDCLVTEEQKKEPVTMNAFELISMARGLDLSPLFQHPYMKRETRFTSKHPAKEILKTLEETAKPMGFNVEKKNYKMNLKGWTSGRKGQLSVFTEVFQVAPSLFMVELQKSGGDTLEYNKFCKTFTKGIKDIIWKSQNS